MQDPRNAELRRLLDMAKVGRHDGLDGLRGALATIEERRKNAAPEVQRKGRARFVLMASDVERLMATGALVEA